MRRTFQDPKVKLLAGTSYKALQFWPGATATKGEKCRLCIRVRCISETMSLWHGEGGAEQSREERGGGGAGAAGC